MSSAFSKSSVRLSTRARENSVSKTFPSGKRFRKVPFSFIDLWTEALSVKRKLHFPMKTDTCGQGLRFPYVGWEILQRRVQLS